MMLVTRRLILREFATEDWPAVLAYQSDPRYLRYYEWTERTEADTRAFVQRFLDWQVEEPRLKYQLAVTLGRDGRLIGNCGVRLKEAGAMKGELGYEIAPVYWGHGYATEAAAAMMRFGFEALGLHRIWGHTLAENVASRRVMEKLGMHCEGRLRDNQWFKGRWWDAAVYGILEQEWQGTMGQEGAMKSQDVDREQIVQALPGAIEQLIASLEAGRTFDEAIGQLAATPDNALADAFGAMMAEVQAGARRREAMRGMAQRWDVPELTALTEGLITADQEGMPIVEVLRAQLR